MNDKAEVFLLASELYSKWQENWRPSSQMRVILEIGANLSLD